jgi:hypothetical protein
MRAPDTKPPPDIDLGHEERQSVLAQAATALGVVGYDDTQWRKIGESLAPFGININTAMVRQPFVLGGPWQLLDHSAPPEQWPEPLKDVLQGMALYFAVVSTGGMPRLVRDYRKHAARLRQERLSTLRAVLAVLDNPDFDIARALTVTEYNTLRAGLTDLIARLSDFIDAGSGRRQPNASKAHIQYWTELKRLWDAITADAGSHKDLKKFLFACSSPVFPAATKDQTLTAFIERHFPANKLTNRISFAGK